MRFAESVAFTLAVRFLSLFIGVLFSILIARTLGPQGTGALAAIAALTALLAQLANLGWQTSGIYLVSQDKNRLSQVAANSFWISILLGGLLTAVTIIVFYFHPKLGGEVPLSLIIIGLLAVPFNLLTIFFQSLLLALHKIVPYNLVELFWRFFYLLVGAAFLLIFKFKITSIVMLTTLLAVVLALAYAHHLYRKEGARFWQKPQMGVLKQMLGLGFRVYLGCFFFAGVMRLTTVLVNYFQGTSATGLFSVASGFGELLALIPSTIGLILFPHIARNVSDKGELTAAVCRHTLVIMLVFSLLLAVFAKPLINLLYGPAFAGSWLPFLILLPGVFFISLQTILLQDIFARGIPPAVYLIPGTGLLLSLALNFLLIPLWGIKGAALSISLAYLIMFIMALFYYTRLTGKTAAQALVPSWGELKNTVRQEVANCCRKMKPR